MTRLAKNVAGSLALGSALWVSAARASEPAPPLPPTPTVTSNVPPAPTATAPEETSPMPQETDAAVAAVRAYIEQQSIDTSRSDWRTALPKFPEISFDGETTYRWNLKTNKGDLSVKLLPTVAPNHVANFIYLTELGFFDGLSFHRVIPGFMAQGGCPLGTGTGSPGYRFAGEFDPSVKHDRPGLLSMANAGPNTDGSQFFLTFAATPWLDGKHTIFGELAEGEETLRALEKAGSGSGRTSEPLRIEQATISVQ